MSRAFAPVNAEPAQTKSARVVQRRCSSCGNSTRPTGPCPECEKKKRHPFQARLQVSTPGDAGEREAERAADDVMHGRLPQVQARSPLDLLQRQETQAETPPPTTSDTRPETPPADGGAGSGSGSTAGATAASSTPTCTPTGFTRADFLTQPGTSVNEFGLTRLNISAVTQPSVTTSRVRGGVRIDSTTAALPSIPSVFTGADTFTEGTAHFIDQDHTSGCSSGRLPIRWTITTAGADRISAGEQEHCADFQLAFDLSLRRFAAAVNALATAGTVFANQARAERAVTRRVGVAPADWSTVFTCLARKTLDRDRLNLHLPRPTTRSPRPADGCAFVRSIVSGTSLPGVGTLASADLVRDCGENGTARGPGRGSPGPRRRGSGSVGKPDLSNATWESSDHDEDEAQLLQRDALSPAAAAVAPSQDATVDQALSSHGQPLDGASRTFMESRFARDFSQVRIHTDAAAAASAEALRAHAYTAGHDIVFNRGAYAPHTERGRHLLAHELAHVVQQARLPASARSASGHEVQRLIQRQPTSISGIPEAERRAIHMGTIAVSVPAARITAFFTSMPSGRPSESRSVGATNSFDPAIPAALHTGLGSIAAYVAGDTNGLPLNSSIELDLDLSAHGGARTTYRFTYFTHATGTGRTATSTPVMLIEQVGAVRAAPTAATVPGGGTFTIGSTGFTLTGRWTDGDYTILREALTLLPAAALTAAARLTFRRVGAGTGAEGGHYDSGTDAVELNNRAFPAGSDLRFGQRPAAVRNVLHEVGHAIDLRVLERAWQAYNSAGQTAAARRTLLAVRSPAGSRWGRQAGTSNDEIQQNAGDAAPAFRAAVRRDGVRRDTSGSRTTPEGTTATLSGGVTTYSETDYQEMYAESFAMYVGARETLRQLRPATFAYFQGLYP